MTKTTKHFVALFFLIRSSNDFLQNRWKVNGKILTFFKKIQTTLSRSPSRTSPSSAIGFIRWTSPCRRPRHSKRQRQCTSLKRLKLTTEQVHWASQFLKPASFCWKSYPIYVNEWDTFVIFECLWASAYGCVKTVAVGRGLRILLLNNPWQLFLCVNLWT